MRSIYVVTLIFASLWMNSAQTENDDNPKDWNDAKSIYDYSARRLNSEERVSLESYKGHVCIIVNVASNCGYTENHYKELNELFEQYSETKGLRILAFPSDQFLQESGTETEIEAFAKGKNVKFDMFEKVQVNGDDAHPLFNYLKNKQEGTLGNFIKWNFTKFIVDKNGQPVERFGPTTSPKELLPYLEKYW